MNYRGRVMELDFGWPVAELRCMAAEMASEADAEIARLAEANRYLVGISNEAMGDARKYAAAQVEIARLREALADMLSGWVYIRQTHGDLYGVGWNRAEEKARAALAPAKGWE